MGQRHAVVGDHHALVGAAVEQPLLARILGAQATVAQHELAEAAAQRHHGELLGARLAELVDHVEVAQQVAVEHEDRGVAVRHARVEVAQRLLHAVFPQHLAQVLGKGCRGVWRGIHRQTVAKRIHFQRPPRRRARPEALQARRAEAASSASAGPS